ncbi:unnamed protein product [Caenorhabditis bovis]|uniref:snRNA-activating protein complex subunit 3 n=1 Tax=Caenorhabditis bovis TaxID=2654633 RepID=A0A8S1EYD0_9PELO|nr:unnamed protein product [Caenorhabditis bovis]
MFHKFGREAQLALNQALDGKEPKGCLMECGMNHLMADNILASIELKAAEDYRRRNMQYKSIALRSLRYDRIDYKALARQSPYRDDRLGPQKPIEFPKDYSDMIVAVSVYHGYSRELKYHEVRLGRLLKVTDRIELTGENTLADLRNAFGCPADYTFCEDFSEKKPQLNDIAKNKFPSSMFFIHDTFYIDPSDDPNVVDPSLEIRNWASRRRSMFDEFDVRPMRSQKIGELVGRLGLPYVYIHQGVCEHLVVLNDVIMRNESHDDVEFPRRLIERNSRRVSCALCAESSAEWAIMEHDDLLPSNPGFLCDACYRELCFDANQRKVCNFVATPYFDKKEVGECSQFVDQLRF